MSISTLNLMGILVLFIVLIAFIVMIDVLLATRDLTISTALDLLIRHVQAVGGWCGSV